MKKVYVIWLIILLMGFVNCGRSTSQNSILGRYELVGYDTSGRLVYTGTISLMSLEQNHLKGQCTIAKEKDDPKGLPEKNGGCEGLVDGKKVSFDFAPSLDDAGLLLDGQFDDSRISGVWKLDGFATSEPLGKFEAVKKE